MVTLLTLVTFLQVVIPLVWPPVEKWPALFANVALNQQCLHSDEETALTFRPCCTATHSPIFPKWVLSKTFTCLSDHSSVPSSVILVPQLVTGIKPCWPPHNLMITAQLKELLNASMRPCGFLICDSDFKKNSCEIVLLWRVSYSQTGLSAKPASVWSGVKEGGEEAHVPAWLPPG